MGDNIFYYEKSNSKSHKFYEINFNGCKVNIIYGRIGTKGRYISKTFSSPKEAQKHGESMIKKKLSKVYISAIKGKTLPKFKPNHLGQLLIPF